MTKSEVAELIEAFIDGRSGDWDWDDFISVKQSDSELENVRVRCSKLPEIFPPTQKGHFCGVEGFQKLKEFAAHLRG